MKIGVVTYFNIKNYGSALQAFALKEAINGMGNETVFIDVKETKKIDRLLHKIHVAGVTLIKCLFSKEARNTQKEILRLKKTTTSTVSKKSSELFDEFSHQNLTCESMGRIQLKKVASTDEYGAFICGSDQIWSPLSTHLSGFKFLSFAPKSKRIAYAPSFGVSKIPGYNKRFVKNKLLGFDDVSVREYDGANIVKELTGKTPPVVLDPTMLLSGTDWRKYYTSKSDLAINESYILCYFFDEPQTEIVDKIISFADERDLSIVVLSSGNTEFIKRGANCVDAGPWEFLSLVDNAQYIFTNSFHGCVFSVLFEKQFIAFPRSHSDTVKQVSRIETLLTNVNSQKSFYTDYTQDFVFSDTANFENDISDLRKISQDYLKRCLAKRS